jgi:hypothetical protein
MQRLEVSGAVRHLYGSLGVKRLMYNVGCYRRRADQSGRDVQLTTPLHPVPRLGISGALFLYPISSVSPDYYLMHNSY